VRVIVFLCLLLLAPVARAADPIAVVPYRIDYFGWFTVSAMVNGKGPYDFIIDTGATQSLVFENLAALHTFEPSGGPPQTVLGLVSQGELPTFNIGEVTVGEARLDNLVTVILGDWRQGDRSPQGVLGLDFLTRYAAVFDAENGLLSLYHRDTPPETYPRKWKTVELTADGFDLGVGDLYTVEGSINTRRVRFLVDLGSGGTLINRQARSYIAARPSGLGVVLKPSAGAGSGRVKDALDKIQSTRPVVVGRLKIGRVSWNRRIFSVIDAPIFKDLGVDRHPFGLLGADLLVDRSFALDFGNGSLIIGPPLK
jgi:predicted aspartyl protease